MPLEYQLNSDMKNLSEHDNTKALVLVLVLQGLSLLVMIFWIIF